MCQQTQIVTALPYYERWMARFPNAEILAAAEEQEALALWAGLGYYRRCRDLLAAARVVARDGFPTNAAIWRRLPGIGRYTAGAVASIALGESTAAVDGNVERVFARLTGSEQSGTSLTKAAWKWAESVLDPERPGDWNQALMELGALVCTPRDPRCSECPLASDCVARRESRQAQLPRRAPRRASTDMLLFVAAPTFDDRVGLRPVPAGRWWEGMWEFPTETTFDALGWIEGDRLALPAFRHVVTRHRVTLRPWRVACVDADPKLTWVSPDEAATYPLPAPQRRVLTMLDNKRTD